MGRRTFIAIAILLAGALATAGCDPSDVDRLPRATVGKRCANNGAFARNATQVLQCAKGRWRVSTSIAAAKAMITAANAAQTTTPAPRRTPTTAPSSGSANIESVTASGGYITVAGWVAPRTSAAITVDGVVVPSVLNVPTIPGNYPYRSYWAFSPNISRPDVVGVHFASATAGFSATIDATTNPEPEVCVAGLASSPFEPPRAATPLSCRKVAVAERRTFPPSFAHGYFDTAVLSGDSVIVSGWALRTGRSDEDVLPQVLVNLSGAGGATTSTWVYTGIDRPDVGAAFPGTGIRHGFSAVLPRNGMACPCTVSFDTDLTAGWLDESERPFGTLGTRLTLFGTNVTAG